MVLCGQCLARGLAQKVRAVDSYLPFAGAVLANFNYRAVGIEEDDLLPLTGSEAKMPPGFPDEDSGFCRRSL